MFLLPIFFPSLERTREEEGTEEIAFAITASSSERALRRLNVSRTVIGTPAKTLFERKREESLTSSVFLHLLS